MKRNGVAVLIVNDDRNRLIAETSTQLLGQSAYADCPCGRLNLDAAPALQARHMLETHNVALAHLGIPGRADYAGVIDYFLEALSAITHKPAAGIITHDAAHTRYTVEEWLNANPRAAARFPAGRLNIVDARTPMNAAGMEKTLSVLSGHSFPLSPSPFTAVSVGSLSRQELVVSI